MVRPETAGLPRCSLTQRHSDKLYCVCLFQDSRKYLTCKSALYVPSFVVVMVERGVYIQLQTGMAPSPLLYTYSILIGKLN